MKRVLICLLSLFLASCSLLDDFFNTAQIQPAGKDEKTYAGAPVRKESEKVLTVCQKTEL